MQQSNHIAIGVDLGGTKIAFVAANREGKILATHAEPTLSSEGVDAVIGRIARGVAQLRGSANARRDFTLAGIGIGCPGAVIDGVATNAVNLNWRGVPLVEKVSSTLRDRFDLDVPVWAQNDVNANTIGEMIFGAAQGVCDFVYLAVGTGLGGGAVSGGKLITGVSGYAMEVGHMSVDPAGRLCGCGNHGCVEMYCSGKGLVAGARAHLPNYPNSTLADADLGTRPILDAARAGDLLALRVIDEAAEALGTTMAWSAIILEPSLIVIGGGLGHAASDLLLERAAAAMRARLLPDLAPLINIELSQVESSALGASALVWHTLETAKP